MPRRIVFALALVAALTGLLQGCGGHVYHRVREGETLYAIGWRYGQDYRSIAAWNDIPPPYTIKNGQVLRVAPPVPQWWEEERQEVTTAAASGAERAKSRPTPQRSVSPARADAADTDGESDAPVRWRWPARGKVIRAFSLLPPQSKGVDIGGDIGQPVYAAAPGRVVYSGSGLIGYGKLIIIKHNKVYLSAYAHNDQLLVKEGEEVGVGQEIARMGSTGTTPLLHFEVRRNGKPVNPLPLLEAEGR
jgi:lipoprotein NlpD